MQPKYMLNGETHIAEPIRCKDDITLSIDGHVVDVRIERRDSYHSELVINGVQHRVYAAQDGDKLYIHLDGKSWQLDVLNEFSDADGNEAAGDGKVRAPMPGVVIETNVEVGEDVIEGQCLLLIESMKLQTQIKALMDGVVSRIDVEAGQSFDKATLLVEIVTKEGGSA